MLTNKKYVQLIVALALAVSVAAIGLVGRVRAFEIRGGEGAVTIAANEVIDDDLFVGGETVVVDGTVNGDLLVGGTNVTINGTVKGSLMMAGQVLELNGTVEGTVYAGAMSLKIGPTAEVGRNLLFGGYSLIAESGSVIGRDAVLGGYQAVLGGEVGRDVRVGSGALEINGKVGGDVTAEIGSPDSTTPQFGPGSFMPNAPAAVAPGLRVGSEAEIGGQLTYTSRTDQAGAIQIKPEGGILYQTPQPGEEPEPVVTPRFDLGLNIFEWFLGLVREFIALLILGALTVWRLPALLTSTMDKARSQPLPAAGWGLAAILGGLLAAIIAAILIVILGVVLWVVTLGELSGTAFSLGFSGLGLAFGVFWLLVSYGSKVVVAYLIGQLLVSRLTPQYAGNKAILLLAGLVVYMIVRAIPLIGWLAGLAAILVGVGAMWLVFREWRAARLSPPSTSPMATA